MNSSFKRNCSLNNVKENQKIFRDKLEYLKKSNKDNFVEIDLTQTYSKLKKDENIKSTTIDYGSELEKRNFRKPFYSTNIDKTYNSVDNLKNSPKSVDCDYLDELKTQSSGKLIVKNIKQFSNSHRRIKSFIDTKRLEMDDFTLNDNINTDQNINPVDDIKSNIKSSPNIITNQKNIGKIFDFEMPSFENFNKFIITKEKIMSSVKADLISKRAGIGLTMNDRPEGLPPKSKDELENHMKLYQGILKNNINLIDKESKIITAKMLDKNIKEEKLNNEYSFWNDIVENWTNKTILNRKFCKKYCEGLPTYIRGKIWKLFSKDKISIAYEVFDELFNQSYNQDLINNEIYHSIEIDVERTFPELKLFQKNHLMHNDLSKLLFSFHIYNSNIGYAQGMSYPMAIFILNLDPFDAFVSFNNFINTPLFTTLYSCNLSKLEQIYIWFETFLSMENPKLVYHMHSIQLSPSLYLLDWLMSSFSKIFSLEIVSRFFDMYFIEGTFFFIKCAMMIVLYHQNEILKIDDSILCAQLLTSSLTHIPENTVFSLISSINNYRDYYNKLENTLKFT